MNDLTPAEMLERNVVLSPTQVAYVAGLLHKRGANKGKPDARAAIELIKAGRLPLTDDSQPITRWSVPVSALKRYLGVGQ